MPARKGAPSKVNHMTAAPTEADPHRRLRVGDYIAELMENTGRRASLCGLQAGVGRRTVDGWLKAAGEAEDKDAKGHLLTPDEVRLLEFLRQTRMAHARWASRQLDALTSIAKGGLVIGKVVEKVDPTRKADGTPMPRDAPAGTAPFVLERKVEQSRALPNEQAIRWLLERLAVDEDGQRVFAPRVEVTGADGGPVEVEDSTVRARRLLDQAEAFVQGAAEGAARAAELAARNGSE